MQRSCRRAATLQAPMQQLAGANRAQPFFVHANIEKCRLLLSEVVPQRWDRSGMELHAQQVGKLSYIFDGAVYEHEPFLTPVIDDYWTRVRKKIGLSPSRHPMLAVAASDDCTINALPWWELGVLS
jgi:hypothetical protein